MTSSLVFSVVYLVPCWSKKLVDAVIYNEILLLSKFSIVHQSSVIHYGSYCIYIIKSLFNCIQSYTSIFIVMNSHIA